MTDTPPQPPAGLKMGELKKFIQDTVAEVVGKPADKPVDKSDDKTETTGDIASRVRAEIEKIRGQEKTAEQQKTLESEIAALKESTKEKPPVERRRVHKLMGWGD
jgi:gas vesicle protein